MLADSDFMNYIKLNYSNLSFISSTTKCLNKKDFLQELHNNEFIEVCLDYNLNHNWELLNSLTDEEKERCEFLCNAICPPACPMRKRHYTLNGVYNLNFGKNYEVPYCLHKPYILEIMNVHVFHNMELHNFFQNVRLMQTILVMKKL